MLWTGVTLFPTFTCNFSCPFCAFSSELNRHRHELALDEMEKIGRNLGRVLVLHIGGGEPFIRQDLPQVLQAWWRHTGVRKVEIPTNGWSAGRIAEKTRRILELCPGLRLNVRVSLDGIEAQHDQARRHPGSYQAAVETLEALRELTRRFPKLSTGICQTVTAHNQDAALSTYGTIRDRLRPDSMVLNACREGSMADRQVLEVLPARYAEVIRTMNDDVDRGKWWNYPRSGLLPSAYLNALHATVWELIAAELTGARPAVRCSAGTRRTLVIYSNGDAAFCELHARIGNLRDFNYSVRELLASSKAKEELKHMAGCGKRHEVCWHTAAGDPTLNPRIALKVAWRTLALALARVWRHGPGPARGGKEAPRAREAGLCGAQTHPAEEKYL